MYIKAISLDGFKSYAQRTEINGFDQMFNAVTGLNGSGKSNILDGICFVLGITNLSQVVVGGRNKYLINGCNATNTRVQDLFRSVQLNVNNPHFLIMQGRITKVLNMKPAEILSMIEEAAGTRLYESKKEAAQKTIEKKDAKLKEIDTILKEEITPTLTKLKDERSSYLEYQKIIRELEHLNKLYIAYKFVCAEEQRQSAADELVVIQSSIESTKKSMKEMEIKMSELEGKITQLEKKRDMEAGGTLDKLETEVTAKQKINVKAQSDCRSVVESKKADADELKKLEKQYAKDVANMKENQKKLELLVAQLDSLKAASEADEKAHKLAQQHLQEVNAGLMRNEDGAYASLNDQLMGAKKDISQAETEMKQAEMSVTNAKQKLKEKSDSLKKTEMNYKKDEAVCETIKKSLSKLQAEIMALGYEDGKEEKLFADKKQLVQEVQNLQEKLEKLESRFPQLQFDYKDPERGFDRKSVHGLVVRLVTVKDPSTATALEVSAGGKLYNVVVDTEVCGKKLLEKGELKRRVTIIPLNKISAATIGSDVVKRAEALVGKENVHTALSLVGYKSELQSAMEFVFGNSFVCTDMDTAKKVTFDERVNKKSVTLDGDSFDPAGTLTGGARVQKSSVLLSLTELNEASNALDKAQQKLQQVNRELDSVKNIASKWRELKQQYDLKSQEAELLGNKLKQSSHGQQLEEIHSLQKTLDEQDAVLKKAAETKKKALTRVTELEDMVKNAGAVREKEMKQAEKEVDQAKKKFDLSIKKTKDKEKDAEQIKLELQDMEKELKTMEDQMSSLRDKVSSYDEQLEKLNETAESTKTQLKEAQDKLNAQKDLLKGCSREINEMQAERSRIVKDCNNSQLQLQELEHKVTKCHKDSKDSARFVEQMLSDHAWILDEKRYFGHANTAYDFNANDPKEAGRRIQKLQDTKDKLSKSVNMRAMNMLGKAEEQYTDLMKKRKIVLSDKAKIASVIAELDEKKNEALKKAYNQVNKDFGSIFSTLLPGAKAKLMAPEGLSILDGLEFKVAFGDVWKDSLSELSGGQRSLVALSLILSLLLFNPAPLYILDEVDAALDLSHTQNIGQMLKTHFRHSQFIVVSLKDGMFSNANVLFKTKFVDGVSSVTRHVQRQ